MNYDLHQLWNTKVVNEWQIPPVDTRGLGHRRSSTLDAPRFRVMYVDPFFGQTNFEGFRLCMDCWEGNRNTVGLGWVTYMINGWTRVWQPAGKVKQVSWLWDVWRISEGDTEGSIFSVDWQDWPWSWIWMDCRRGPAPGSGALTQLYTGGTGAWRGGGGGDTPGLSGGGGS